jgi:3-oxoacyl-[acyl-carrier protein] reductase
MMDLGLKGRKALICAASKGMGRACAESLAREGCEVWITARHGDVLEATAAAIRKATGMKVTAVAGDIATEAGRDAALAACPDPDILVNNAGGPPTGDFRNFTHDDWNAALEANMLAPIFLMKATVDGMARRRFGRIVNITSSTVKQPFASLALSNGARNGLTGFVAGLAREVARHNVTVNNLLPGSIATERGESFVTSHAKARGIGRDEALAELERDIPAGRFGTPEEFGEACAFLCSAQAGYITGQNLLIDGGAYPGTF